MFNVGHELDGLDLRLDYKLHFTFAPVSYINNSVCNRRVRRYHMPVRLLP